MLTVKAGAVAIREASEAIRKKKKTHGKPGRWEMRDGRGGEEVRERYQMLKGHPVFNVHLNTEKTTQPYKTNHYKVIASLHLFNCKRGNL